MTFSNQRGRTLEFFQPEGHLGQSLYPDNLEESFGSSFKALTTRVHRKSTVQGFHERLGEKEYPRDHGEAGIVTRLKEWMERESERHDRFVNDRMTNLVSTAANDGLKLDAEVKTEAERILRALMELPGDAEVLLDVDGTISIEVSRPPIGSFGIFCEPGYEAFCVVYADGASRRARYGDSRILPDGFVRDGLRSVLTHHE